MNQTPFARATRTASIVFFVWAVVGCSTEPDGPPPAAPDIGAASPDLGASPPDVSTPAPDAAQTPAPDATAPPRCGDGQTTAGEACDDGNNEDGDGCDSDCSLTACGNGITTEGEICDDGNAVDGDGCDANCTATGCGNGIITDGEACDDGNQVDRDECRSGCTLNVDPVITSVLIAPEESVQVGQELNCSAQAQDANDDELEFELTWLMGDEVLHVGATLTVTQAPGAVLRCRAIARDWHGASEAAYASITVSNRCGDGFSADGEPCDDGNDVDGDGCDTNCTETGCGNGVVTEGELCDDGNRAEGDGCDTNCTATACGNGVQSAGEVCDDGNNIDGDDCDSNCTLTGCGNGIVTPEEVCDDGNAVDGDDCDSNCTVTGCGNGIVTIGEACDDGNDIDRDECRAGCTLNRAPRITSVTIEPHAGVTVGSSLTCTALATDGNDDEVDLEYRWLVAGEVVGHGSTIEVNQAPTTELRCEVTPSDWHQEGQPESATVIVENRCGDGFIANEEACDDANDDPNDGCLNTCVLARCGDGVVQRDVEACDDGNSVSADGCTETCAVEFRWWCSSGDPSQCQTTCGDGRLDLSEECDPSIDDGAPCAADCFLEPRCGDGVLNQGEACDDGNQWNADGCSNACQMDEVGLDCVPAPDEDVTINLDGATSLTAIGAHIYWTAGHRVILRADALGENRTHRFLPAPLTGRRIVDIMGSDGALFIRVDEGETGESIWSLPANHFLLGTPELVHRASTITPGGRYLTVAVHNQRLLGVVRDADGEVIVNVGLGHRAEAGCLFDAPAGCGVRTTRLTGGQTTGRLTADTSGHLYAVQLPSEGEHDAAVLRIDPAAEAIDLSRCGPLGSGDDCERLVHGPSLISSATVHRGALYFVRPGDGVFRQPLRHEALATRLLDLGENQGLTQVHASGPKVYISSSQLRAQRDWRTNDLELITEEFTVDALRQGAGFVARLQRDGLGEYSIGVRFQRPRLCSANVASLGIDAGNVLVRNAATAGGGLTVVGRQTGTLLGQASRGHDGYIAQWSSTGLRRSLLNVSSVSDDGGEHLYAVVGDGVGGVIAAGHACHGVFGECELELRELNGPDYSERLPLGLVRSDRIGLLLGLNRHQRLKWHTKIVSGCVPGADCVVEVRALKRLGAHLYGTVSHRGDAQWIAEGAAPIPIPGDGSIRTTVFVANLSGQLLYQHPFTATNELWIHDLAVGKVDAGARVVLGGQWKGTLSHELDGRSARHRGGLVAELVIRLEDPDGPITESTSRLFSAETLTDYAHTSGVAIGQDGAVWATGGRYSSTNIVSAENTLSIPSSRKTDAWVAVYRAGVGLIGVTTIQANANDMLPHGVALSEDGEAYITTHSANQTNSIIGLVAMNNEAETLWRREVQPHQQSVTRYTRPLYVGDNSLLSAGVASHPSARIPYVYSVGHGPSDSVQEVTGAAGVLWAGIITSRPSGVDCADDQCVARCGDGLIALEETCDDGNDQGGDGCSENCLVEAGFGCHAMGAPCEAICGDGRTLGSEDCDDGNLIAHDGCDARCRLQDGYICNDDSPALCAELPPCIEGEEPVAPCLDEDAGRCEPLALCGVAPPAARGMRSFGSRCFGPDCQVAGCAPEQAGDARPCGRAVGECRQGHSVCDGYDWSECQGAFGAQEESCNGLDDDCDGSTDEDLGTTSCGTGECAVVVAACIGGAPNQCAPRPPVEEACNTLDDDCDGRFDEHLDTPVTCGVGACAVTAVICDGGVSSRCQPLEPTPEVCNGVDDDCDGVTDELPPISCGNGPCSVTVPACADGRPNECTPNDDLAADQEVCNIIDDDCDGIIDEQIPDQVCGEGACQRTVAGCNLGAIPLCEVGQVVPEICNGIDDDCDGSIDNGVRCLDFACELPGAEAAGCEPEDPFGENRAPRISSLTSIRKPDANRICLNGHIGGGFGGGLGGGLGGGDIGVNPGGGGGPVVFQTCALQIAYGDPDGPQPRLSVQWGDDTVTDPVTWPCLWARNPDVYSIPHNYIASGEYDVVVRAEDNDGLAAESRYRLIVTLPETDTERVCGPLGCFDRLVEVSPGSCQVTSPLYYFDGVDSCVPLQGATFCDPNNPESFCPGEGCVPGNPSFFIPVYTAEPGEGQFQWSWNDGALVFDEELPSLECTNGQNYIGRNIRMTCGTDRQLRANNRGVIRRAQIKVGNRRPNVEILGGNMTVVAGERFELSTQANDPDGEVVRYRWEIDDRECASEGAVLEDFEPSVGEHVVKVTAFDNSGGRAIDAIRMTVLPATENISTDRSGLDVTVPVDGVTPQSFALTVPADVEVASAEIFIGHLTHDEERDDKLRGRISWDPDNGFSLIPDLNNAPSGSRNIEIHPSSDIFENEDGGLTVTFAFVPQRTFGHDGIYVGPLDIAYRVEADDGTYVDATETNAEGWFNSETGFYAVDLWPIIGAYDREELEPNVPVHFMLLVDKFVGYWNVPLAQRVRIFSATERWEFGDGHESSRPWHTYRYPGAYPVRYTITYDNGWEVQSTDFTAIIRGDTDGDGVEDHLDPDIDDDGVCNDGDAVAGVCDAGPDQLPRNPMHSADRDGDGVGDDLDACQRATPDFAGQGACRPDLFPDDPEESWDNDRDGIGDNADDDDDNDGLSDAVELELGTAPTLPDTDGDGLSDGEEAAMLDGSWSELDSDGDGLRNILDIDSDDDGLPDGQEPFPFQDPDGDGVASILDRDADNDGVEDGLDRTPWAEWSAIREPAQWRDLFPTGYIVADRRFAVADWRGELEKMAMWPPIYPGDGWDEAWDDSTFSSLPGTWTDDLHDDILPRINEQMSEFAYDCRHPRERNEDNLPRFWTGDDYYGPHIVHPYKEWLTYQTRFRSIHVECSSLEPKEITDNVDRRHWQHASRITLREGADNLLTYQFTLNSHFRGFLPYGRGEEIDSNSEIDYVLPALYYRLYRRVPGDRDSLTDFAAQGRLRHEGSAVATKLAGTSQDGRPIFEVTIRFPHESVSEADHWLLISPRVETSFDDGFRQYAMNPADESFRVTSVRHRVSGLYAHLATRISETVFWDQIQGALVDHMTDEATGFFEPETLSAASGVLVLPGEGRNYRVAVVNRLVDADAAVENAVVNDPRTDGILVVTNRPEEVASVVSTQVNCDRWDGCDWYLTDDGTANGARDYQAGNVFGTTMSFDRTERPANERADWFFGGPMTPQDERGFWDDGRSASRAFNDMIDSYEAHKLKFNPRTFNPMTTLDSVFQRYGIEVTRKGSNRGNPRWQITLKNTELAQADGLEAGPRWAWRKRGVDFENDLLTETFNTGLDDEGNAILPREFQDHGVEEADGGDGRPRGRGSRAISELLEAQTEAEFLDSVRPRGIGRAMDNLGRGAGVFGIFIGAGMMMEHETNPDGIFEGGVLVADSSVGLLVDYRSALALKNARTTSYAVRMSSAARWNKVGLALSVAFEGALAVYYFSKVDEHENPIVRRQYSQLATASVVNAGISAMYPYGAVFVGAWSITTAVYSYFDLPASDFVAAQVSDPGMLLTNLALSFHARATETWKIEACFENEVAPVLAAFGQHYHDLGYGIVLVGYDD